MKILKLHGTIEEKINTMLENAGWYAGRRVNIDDAVRYYDKYGLVLSEKAKSFISEYYGLADDWYFDTSNIDRAPDFEFNLFPYPKSYATDVVDFMYDDDEGEVDSEEYAAVKAIDKNACMVGEIGYYYPARVWIGDSGALLCTHEYDDEVHVFNDITELIRHEILGHEPEVVCIKNNLCR